MSNDSRRGAAHQCESANACIYNVYHTAPVDERPQLAKTFCGKVYQQPQGSSKSSSIRPSLALYRAVTAVLLCWRSLPVSDLTHAVSRREGWTLTRCWTRAWTCYGAGTA